MERDPHAYISIVSKYFTPHEISRQCLFTADGVGLYCCKPNYCTVRSPIDSYMIACVLTGEAVLEYRKKTYYLKEGELFFISCYHDPQRYYTGSTGIWEQMWFHFNSSSFSPLYEFFYNSNGGPVVKTDPQVVKSIKAIMNSDFNTSIIDDARLSCMISEIVYLTFSSGKSSKAALNSYSHGLQSIPDRVINYIKSNYTQRISLVDIARCVHLNPSYLSRMFKKHTGLSPYAYLIRYRIIMAKQPLADTDQEICTIALNYGFQSASRFCKLFHEFEKITPKQFRQKSRNIL